MTKSSRSPVPLAAIEDQLGDQINFLNKSCSSFDSGDTSEYKRLATTLRVLFHNSRNSKSLISQLGSDDLVFPSFIRQSDPNNLMVEIDLSIIEMSDNGSKLLPAFDFLVSAPRRINFDQWWSESVLRDDHRVHFSRADFVRTVADQDGGAHVDPEIETKYHRLMNENSIGFVELTLAGEKPLRQIERVYLRHIAFEALRVLEPHYLRIVGNRQCRCGSERKARYCCDKGKSFEDVYSAISA